MVCCAARTASSCSAPLLSAGLRQRAAVSGRVAVLRPQGPLGRVRGVHPDTARCPLGQGMVSTRTGAGCLLGRVECPLGQGSGRLLPAPSVAGQAADRPLTAGGRSLRRAAVTVGYRKGSSARWPLLGCRQRQRARATWPAEPGPHLGAGQRHRRAGQRPRVPLPGFKGQGKAEQVAVLDGLGWRRTNDALGPVVRDTDGRVVTLGTVGDMPLTLPFPQLVNQGRAGAPAAPGKLTASDPARASHRSPRWLRAARPRVGGPPLGRAALRKPLPGN
jgi:hypothetical protein